MTMAMTDNVTVAADATASASLNIKPRCGPLRTCCRGWLATALASMCMIQVVLSTGVWMKPYSWWLFSDSAQLNVQLEQGRIVQLTTAAQLPG